MKFCRLILIVVLIMCSQLLAGSFGQPGAFLRFGANARALALGGAYSTIARNADALLYNPAGLASLERWELTITHAQLYMDSRYEFASFAYPMDKIGNFGVGIADMGASNFDGRDVLNRSTGDFGIHQLAAIVGYGKWFWGRRIQVGGSAKFWMSSVADSSASGFGGIDIGIVTKDIMRKLRLSAAVKNLGAMEVAGDQLPMTIRIGALYKVLRRLYLITDVEIVGSAIKPMIGAEAKLGKVVVLRTGYNLSEITFGFGMQLDKLIASFKGVGRPSLDYAAAVMNSVGNDFARFSLTFRGAERYRLSDLLVQKNPCEKLTEFEGMLDKEGLIGAKANLMFGDCYFTDEYLNAPLSSEANFKDAYGYLREAYLGKFGTNWTREVMSLEGANLIFSQRTHYMFAEATMHIKGISEETKKLVMDLIFVGGDSAQYDARLEYDLAYCYENLGYPDSAKDIYGRLANREELEDPVRPLSMYRLAWLLRESNPDSSISLLDRLVRNFGWGFYSDKGERLSYPMFPKLKDNSVADDALLMMGDIYLDKGGPENTKKALLAYLDIALFYPNAEKHILKTAYEKAAQAYETLGMDQEASQIRDRSNSL